MNRAESSPFESIKSIAFLFASSADLNLCFELMHGKVEHCLISCMIYSFGMKGAKCLASGRDNGECS